MFEIRTLAKHKFVKERILQLWKPKEFWKSKGNSSNKFNIGSQIKLEFPDEEQAQKWNSKINAILKWIQVLCNFQEMNVGNFTAILAACIFFLWCERSTWVGFFFLLGVTYVNLLPILPCF